MSVTDPATPTRGRAGIDWAKDDHAVCVVGAEGEALHRFTVRHDAAGLRELVRRLLKLGCLEPAVLIFAGAGQRTLMQQGLNELGLSRRRTIGSSRR